ncbi:MAG: ATP-binding protein, partial [Candidatus Omnitrophota bacterium]
KLDANNKRLLKLDRLKSNFVSMVSHELRTPLAITKEGIRLLLDKVPGKINKKQQEILVAANTHIDRLTRIINNLLDISRIEAGKVDLKRDQVNIIELVRGTARTFEPQIKDKGLQLRLDLPCGRMEGYVDADKISQTLINLLSNAVKFTQKGYIEISLKESINEIECMVADSGEGISTENLSKLFDKFQQFSRMKGCGEKGTGLGLSIAKEFVEMHKGKIWAESKFKKGTRFIFTLPKYTPETLFRECVDKSIKNAVEKDSKVSLIIASAALGQKLEDAQAETIIRDIQAVLKSGLRRQEDIALRCGAEEVAIVLTQCNKRFALSVMDRLERLAAGYLQQKRLTGRVTLRFNCATYPDEALDSRELVEKAKETKKTHFAVTDRGDDEKEKDTDCR